MKKTNQNNSAINAEEALSSPILTMQRGNTTYQVCLHFNKSGKEALTDKMKRLIRNDLQKKGMD